VWTLGGRRRSLVKGMVAGGLVARGGWATDSSGSGPAHRPLRPGLILLADLVLLADLAAVPRDAAGGSSAAGPGCLTDLEVVPVDAPLGRTCVTSRSAGRWTGQLGVWIGRSW